VARDTELARNLFRTPTICSLDFEGAFQAAAKGRASALMTIRDALINRYRKRIAETVP